MTTTILNKNIPIAIGSDHAGFEYKTALIKMLQETGYLVEDLGTNSLESCDYPDYAHAVAKLVETGSATFGILICGSGNGVCMAANKHAGIRAALCWTEELASLARSHNNANILCIPARFVTIELAIKMTNTFLSVPFEGGRHQRRVEKI